MKNRTLLSISIFLLFFCVIFSSDPISSLAKDRRASAKDRRTSYYTDKRTIDLYRATQDEKIKHFESLSNEDKTPFFKGLNDSDKLLIFNRLTDNDKQWLFEDLSDDDKVWLLENVSDDDKLKLFRALGDEDKPWIFENLSDDDKEKIFRQLTATDKQKVFKELSDASKRRIFRGLNDAEKQKIFSELSPIDQRRVFKGLSDDDKKKLFDTLSSTKKEEWLKKYPELEFAVTREEIPSVPPKEGPPVRPEEVEVPSDIEKIMSGQFPTEITRDLRQYGYDFFAKEASPFTPLANIPVGPDYVIGPGDNFTIHLWGKAEETYSATVTREGRIILPRLGTLNVNGLTLAELNSYLAKKFKEYYPEFEMSITMGTLRSVEIFVVGEARNPGTYSVSSLSTAITAISTAGGPSKNGSLRNIKISRNGVPIKSLDLYDFFINGTKTDDIRLQPGDTIFIPVLGPVVGVAGCVKRPAIYEIKGDQTIGDVIELAGGTLPIGHLQNVVIERVKGHKRRVINSFNLEPSHDRANQNLKLSLQDGDVIKIYPVHKTIQKVVYLEGHVKYPREYELKPGMRLTDIISSYDYLLPEPYLPQAEIIRLVPPDLHPEIIEFNLRALMAGDDKHNLLLKDLDRVIIYSAWEKKDKPGVTIKGAVRNPSTFRLYEGMRIKDLIFQAGNLTRKAYLEDASLTRIVPGENQTATLKLSFSPRKAMAGVPEDNILLQEDDLVYIREIPEYGQALERKVFLEGEFLFPGEYTFPKGERLGSLIEKARGLTQEAYPFGAVFQRESVKDVQGQRLKEYVSKLEEDLLTMSALTTETALDKEQAAILQQSLTTKRQLLEKLKKAVPTGRMVIQLDEVLADPSSSYNFELQPGDRLIVKKRPDYVNVMGEVYNPTALFAEKDKTVSFYLNRVGGPTDNADKKQVYVVKANGSVISKSQGGFFGVPSWDSENRRWVVGGFDAKTLDPGDTIIVPKKVEKYPWLRLTKDITQIMYQIAVSAGVIIVAF
jgi:protein involved in polysaccharide export with SLBB domain